LVHFIALLVELVFILFTLLFEKFMYCCILRWYGIWYGRLILVLPGRHHKIQQNPVGHRAEAVIEKSGY
jgi:hypothetical protein